MPKLTALHKGKSIQVEYTGTDNVMIALYDDIDWGTCGGSCACGGGNGQHGGGGGGNV